MDQTISVTIDGSFPNYEITFSADPAPVPANCTQTITYELVSDPFSFVGVNLQRDPFNSGDELTWAIPFEGRSLILTDVNSDPLQTTFGLELVFQDKSGNTFSSTDPQVVNEGVA